MTDFTPENSPDEPFDLDALTSSLDQEVTLNGGTERFYNVGEKIFGSSAVLMRQLGWTVFPQERDDRRMPSKVDGRALKWSKWYDLGPTVEETARWAAQASNANTAIILGPASSNVFCFDIDIMNPVLSLQIQELAGEILGVSPFRRVGQEPKTALFYRTQAEHLPRNRQIAFAPQAGDDGVQAIEILARGKAITAFGYHHKTGRYFSWLAAQPTYFGPEHAPLLSPARVDEFIDACGKLRPYVQHQRSVVAAGAGFDGALEVSGEWVIPPTRTEGITLNEAGQVNGHREIWLTDMAYDLVRMNPGRVAIADGNGGYVFSQAGMDQAVQVLVDVAAERMSTSGWKRELRKEIVDKLGRSARSLSDGQIKHLPKPRRVGGKMYTQNRITLAAAPTEAAVSILPPRDKRQTLNIAAISPVDADKAAERALKSDRTETVDQVSKAVDGAYAAFFADVYSSETKRKEVHVLKAPTGAGKSSRTVTFIVTDPRTYALDAMKGADESRQGPLLFLMPTYQNINELRERADALGLDAAATDEQLVQDAEDLGLVAAGDVDHEIELMQAEVGTKLETMVYKGKLAAGCRQEVKMKLVLEAGISSSSLCKGRKKVLGGWEEVVCPFYAACEAIKQRAQIAKSHVVFLPHSFMALTIPEELQNTRGVIADERLFTLFVHTARLKLSNLQRPRKLPKLSKVEEKLGFHPQELIDDRIAAAQIATRELLAGRDPAAALAAYNEQAPKRMITGLSLVKSAARVCGSASSVNVSVHSSMSDDEIAAICSQPTGEEVGVEYRFWKILQDRIEALEKGTALQEREGRIQLLRHAAEDGSVTPLIRISWITQPNWPAAPVLLLDASAHAGIVSKIFPDRTVVMHDITADLNAKVVAVIDKSYSTASLVPHADASDTAKLQAARRLDLYRDARNNICAWNAHGRVLETSMKSVREANSTNFVPPVNLDQIHLGAERGLDFAKQHVASIGLGRMELPVWIMDGLAAALAASDPEPAVLLDPLGTGCLPDGEPLPQALGEIVLPMQDGSDLTIIGAKNPEGWQRVVQQQFREEGLRQGCIGRMRPVYREDTPTVYIFATCIPEGIIVDEVCSLQDLIPSYAPLLEAARWNGGVIDWLMATATRGDLATRSEFKAQFKELPAELKAAYNVVRYDVDGIGVLAGVPAIIEDPVAHLKLQLARVGICFDAEPVVIKQAVKGRVAPAGAREDDALEAALGSPADRRLAEHAAREAALQASLSYEPGKGRYNVGEAINAQGDRVALSLTAMALLKRFGSEAERPPKQSSAVHIEQEAI
ncbi:MAG TPA: bifunctional DNA primase/polymerase [Ramlibacter sp.]|jgi:hypothetical protein